jgi:hypothetical protein
LENRVQYLQVIQQLNSRLFINSLQGISNELATERPSEHNNPFIWIATHTVWARYNMLIFLGQPVSNPYVGKFENFKAYDASDGYPTLETVQAEWTRATQLLGEALEKVTAQQLKSEAPIKNPTGDFTNGGTLAFLVQHESYTIGQMAFLKKFLTKEAIKY